MAETTGRTSINLGSVSRIPPGQGRCYIVGTEEVAVYRQRDGGLFATQNRCPHRKGPLAEGVVGGGRVICPLHGHHFDLGTGEGSEATETLTVYPVQDIGGSIILTLSEASR